MNEWTAIDDLYPANGQKVLLIISGCLGFGKLLGYDNDGEPAFYWTIIDGRPQENPVRVTHWMPLPLVLAQGG